VEREAVLNCLRENGHSSGFWYVGTPYSRWPEGLEAAFQEAARVAAWLASRGVNVFCPITHSHPLAVYGKLDAKDHEFWLGLDYPLMAASMGMVAVKMDGWEDSLGMRDEIEYFEAADKPIYYMEWRDGYYR